MMGQVHKAAILLVEDEFLINAMVSEALIEDGFLVHGMGDAEEALEYLQPGCGVDLLFTDLNLPGMDGVTLAARARAVVPDLPVLYASGRWNLLDGLRGTPRCATLRKPYSMKSACAAAEELLGLRHRDCHPPLSLSQKSIGTGKTIVDERSPAMFCRAVR
jgi:DNA-binding response OmpR family regulator